MEAESRSPLRVVHIVAGLDPADGGPAYSVPGLCGALAASGEVDPTLLSVAAEDGEIRRDYPHRQFAPIYRQLPILGSLRLSSGLTRALSAAAPAADVIHGHGLWLAPNILCGQIARRAGLPLVLSPRGMLSPAALAFSRWKKRLMWRLAQGDIVHGAACVHATSEAELSELRALGLRNPIANIPNGIAIPEMDDPGESFGGLRTVLYLGRIHPKKGLASLLEAWAHIENLRPDWRLRIVGPGEVGHDEELRRIAQARQLQRVSIEPPIYGPAKLSAYREAELFVLPTLNENFGMSVAEALSVGTPVISTKGAPWSGLTTEACGWWIDHGAASLADTLLHATSQPTAGLREMGRRGRRWMARDFSWDRVAKDMAEVYAWLAKRGPAPKTVSFV
jgi:glycosyltransferase involved in cell wall biosynthesis